MKCKAIPGLDTEERCLTCQDKTSTMWRVGAEGRSLSFEFFLITIPTGYLMLYLRQGCVTPWECICAFPAKVQRRDCVQRTPPKSCTAQPGICSGRTLGVHPVLHRYHWWREKIAKSLVSLLWFKEFSVHWRNEESKKSFSSFGNFTEAH